jgi:hypothetical protein
MKCRRDSGDKLMMALVQQGINLVLPPRDHVEAGDLILADPDRSIRTGSWTVVFGLTVAPQTSADSSFKSFTFDAASSLKTDASASLLGSILEKFGLASGGFKSAFAGANAETIELSLVAPANRSLLYLDELLGELNKAKAAPAPAYQEKRFFVVTKVWRARGLRLRVLDKSNTQVDLSAQAIKELQASTKLSIKREDRGRYAFTAAEAQIFGLTLRELVPLKDAAGNLVIADRPGKEHMTFRGAPAGGKANDASVHAFIGEDAFVDFPEA